MGEEQKIEIRAYLSYRRVDTEKEERDALKKVCDAKNIELVYDEIGTEEGDNFVDFMNNDLVGARFVIAFLSPDYFTRPYTLHELLEIAKDQQTLSRLNFAPVRMTKNMVATEITSILDAWNLDEPGSKLRKTKEKLAKLQEKATSFTGLDDTQRKEIFKALAGRIEEAWNRIVEPELERVTAAAETKEKCFQYYGVVADKIVAEAEKEFTQEKIKLKKKIGNAVASILKKDTELCNFLINELKMDNKADSEEISNQLLEKGAYGSITQLGKFAGKVVEQQKYRGNSESFGDFCYRAKQLCGWLLLLSVDPLWWVHNCCRINHCLGFGINLSLELEVNSFSEVIISRSVIEQAKFKLDNRGDELIPDRYKIDAWQFDVSEESVKDGVLQPVYKDLKNIKFAPDGQDDLIQGIIKAAKTAFDRKNKPTFYLVSKETHKILTAQNWYQKLVDGLAGKLLFIRTDIPDNSCSQASCAEEVDTLLEAVAYIYRLENL